MAEIAKYNLSRGFSPGRGRAIWCSVAGAIALCAGSAWSAPVILSDELARSADGRPVTVLTVGDDQPDAHDRGINQRPALMIIAGAQGHHVIGTRTAAALAQRLVADHADLLADRTVYIVPMLNPDAAARFSANRPYRAESGRAPERSDADRDGRFDEDPPNDLNGDGLITMMRVPAPNRTYNINPTHVIDADDPRLLREPKPENAEIATHALLIEGSDDDNDGAFNEDGWGGSGGGGTNFDMHFPTHWPELQDGAGVYPLRRPETRALVEWMQERTNIIAVVVYGPHDTLATIPPTGQFGPARRVPKGIEEGDKPVYEMVSKAFKDITGITKAEPNPSRDGSLLQWAYADLGVYAFGTPVWVRPDLVKNEDENAEAGDDAANEAEASSTTSEADARAAEREALLARGVPMQMAAFLTMTAEERAAEMANFENASEAEQQAMMEMVMALPEDVRARVMAIAQGGEDPGPPAAATAESDGESRPARGGRGDRGGGGGSGGGDSADAKWLAWIDDHNNGEGFVDWQPFDHPQLGRVEIGGFVPGVRFNPPNDAVEALVDQQLAFATTLLKHFPVIEFSEPTVERVGPGLYRVGVTATNTGKLPYSSAISNKARRVHPLVLVLDPDQSLSSDRFLSGSRQIRVENIAPNGTTAHAEWLVAADDGARLTLDIRSARVGWQRMTITLEGN